MTPLPKAKCPVCGKRTALRVTGVFREHRNADGRLCPQSGSEPARV